MKRAILVLCLCAASFARGQDLENGLLRVRVNAASRTWDLYRSPGGGEWIPVITGASLSLSLVGGDSLNFMTDGKETAFKSANLTSAEGRGRRMTVTSAGDRIAWTISFALHDGGDALWMSASLKNTSAAALQAETFHLLDAQGEGGAHFTSENLLALKFFGGLMRLDSGATVTGEPAVQFCDKSSNGALLAGFVTNGAAVNSISATSPGNARLALLSSSPEHVTIEPGAEIRSDTLVVAFDDAPFDGAKRFAALLAAHAPALRKPFTPGENMTDLPAIASATSIWRSWPAYRGEISEDTILANLNAAAAHLKSAGLRAIEIDEGYEKAAGDWEINGKFPHGHKWLVDKIHAKGFLAGIWIAPFAAAPGSPVAARHPEWLLRDDADSLVTTPYAGGRCLLLDPGRKDVQAWVTTLMEQVSGWGYDIVHLAHSGAALWGRHAQGMTPGQALRSGLRALRHGAGSAMFLIGSDLPAGVAAGILDAVDAGADAASLRGAAVAAAASIPFDGAAWYGISGPLCVGAQSAAADPRMAASLAVLTGRTEILGDRLTSLDEEQFALLAKTLPVAGGSALPVDLYADTAAPSVWSLTIEKPYGNWHVVGLFNWTADLATIVMDAVPLGLSPGKEYALFDYWGDSCLGSFRMTETFRLPGGGSKLFALHELPRHPAVVSTTRHISQGAVDLVKAGWEEGSLAIDARHLLPGPWTMTLYLPPGMKIRRIAAPWKHTESASGPFVRITFPATQGERMLMTISFE